MLLELIGLIALTPSIPTAVGVDDKPNMINLSEEQSVVRRFSIFSDATEYLDMLLDYLFGD